MSQLEHETLPDDIEEIFKLIEQHQTFMEILTTKQLEVDSVCKPYRSKTTGRKTSKNNPRTGLVIQYIIRLTKQFNHKNFIFTLSNNSRGVSPEYHHQEFSR